MQSTQSVDEEVANALRALIAEANAASQAGDHETALAKFTELAAGVPACADCYDNIGREYLAMNNLDEAEAAFKQAIAFDPNHPNAYNGLANLYNAQKKFDLAAEASAKAAEIGGGAGGASADSLYNQGVVAWNAGKAEEARGHFEAAIAANPKHGPSHFQLGMALVNAGSLPEAKAEFEMYLEIAPQGAFAEQATAMIAAIP
jgi:tetratricopeptide (TPR) repeat protein